MQFFQIFGVLKLLLPLEESWWGSEDMSGSETGCGDGEELGLEAAADAGGLTSFSKEIEGRRESRDIWIRYKVVKHLKDLERDTRFSGTALEELIYSPLWKYKSFLHVMWGVLGQKQTGLNCQVFPLISERNFSHLVCFFHVHLCVHVQVKHRPPGSKTIAQSCELLIHCSLQPDTWQGVWY